MTFARFDDEAANAFLDELGGRKGILTTIGKDGYPHSIPLTYFRVGTDIYVPGRRRSQRLVNITRNPKVSYLVEHGEDMATYRGLLTQGDAIVIEDADEKLRLARAAAQQRGVPERDWPTEAPRGTLIRIPRGKVISWDNTRPAES